MNMPPLYRHFTTQDAIDQAYDPLRPVAHPQAINAHFDQQSQRARRELHCVPGVPYGPTLDETLDIFPADRPDAPVFVFVHGGYWRARTSKDFSCVALGPHALGMTTVVLNYALCPKVTLDEISRQARAGLAWVVRHISHHNGDASRIILGGHSAGAHLSAMCLQTRWQEDYGLPADPVLAAVLVSGIYDIAPLRYSYLQPAIQLDDGIIRRNSPMFGIRPSRSRLLLTWGSHESAEFARQSSEFHAHWQAAGNASELLEQNGCNHFSALHGFERADHPLCQWMQAIAGDQAT